MTTHANSLGLQRLHLYALLYTPHACSLTAFWKNYHGKSIYNWGNDTTWRPIWGSQLALTPWLPGSHSRLVRSVGLLVCCVVCSCVLCSCACGVLGSVALVYHLWCVFGCVSSALVRMHVRVCELV